MTPLLEARGLEKRFAVRSGMFGRRQGFVHAVAGIDLAIAAGETLAIVGESGCGKSTLGRLLLRLIEPDAGALRFRGEDFLALDSEALRRARRHAQIVFQDPFASLNPRLSVGATLAEPIRLHGLRQGSAVADRVAELLELVGLRADAARNFPHEFSGGQRQRIGIARALASEPALIVGDEPVSALDVSVQAQVLNLLSDLLGRARAGGPGQQGQPLAFVLISHDLGVVRHIADRVAVMYLGRIVETGPTEAVFGRPAHPYTRALLAAIPRHEPGLAPRPAPLSGDVPSPLAPPPGCRFHTRCAFAEAVCQHEVPELLAAPSGQAAHQVACHLRDRLPPPPPLAEAGDAAVRQRLAALAAFFDRSPPRPFEQQAQDRQGASA
ncbi:MAG: ATP-binding cassette domain-containing protein [Acetobacteraceae bacterium]|nr:ATP-binding cassette domain-containing protein [Acetobacteraceae bacterium]